MIAGSKESRQEPGKPYLRKVWSSDGGAGTVNGVEFFMRELPNSSTPLPVLGNLRSKTGADVANCLFHCSKENQMPPGACETQTSFQVRES